MKTKLTLFLLLIFSSLLFGQEISLVKDISTDIFNKNGNPHILTEFNGKIYFEANDRVHGSELWVSDGTESGTYLIKDIRVGSNGSNPRNLIVFNNLLYFTINSSELWRTDGTEAGTILIKEINNENSANLNYFVEYNNELYFAADDNLNGTELWKSDGTTEGTSLFKDINLKPDNNPTRASTDSYPSFLVVYDGKLYFTADDGDNGYELWESNGTVSGTKLSVDIRIGEGDSYPRSLIVFNNKLFFSASGNDDSGSELWISDGTPSGTQLFKDINVGSDGSSPGFTENVLFGGNTYKAMEILNNELYFTALVDYDFPTAKGIELWKTDGTVNGTVLVKDINVGSAGSKPVYLKAFGNKIYFSAITGYNNGISLKYLWETDGTEQGTKEVTDVNNNSIAYPQFITVFNNKLFFSAKDDDLGQELFSFTPLDSNNNQPTADIPDQNFEQYLVTNQLDNEIDGKVLIANINGIEFLNISGIDVADLTGIAYFTALKTLLVSNNPNLSTIDISNNSNLEVLNTSNTGVTALDISANFNLTELRSEYTGLTALDISNNMNLKKVFVRNNQITNLTTPFSTSLLEELDVQHNQLSAIEAFGFQELKKLKANNNNLENLDLSSSFALEEISLQNNSLESLQLLLGDNPSITSFDVRNNSQLNCIQVDNVDYATTNFTNVDENTVFNTDCSTLEKTYVPDDNFEQALINLGLDSGDLDDYVPTNNIKVITNLDVSNNTIGSLVGIQDFEALQHLNAANNNLTALRMQNLENVISIDVRNNDLCILKVYVNNVQVFHSSNNPNLACIQVNDVDATNNFAFNGNPDFSKDSQSFFSTNCSIGETYIPDDAFEERLIAFGLDDVLDDYVLTKDINTIENLTMTNAGIEDLTGIQDFKELKNLIVSNNNLTELSFNTNNAKLDIINASFNEIETANFGSIPLKNINISNNKLTSLNLVGNTSLEKINCNSNSNLNELLLPSTSSLTEIRANFCNLNTINIPNAVTRIEIDYNNFTEFDARGLRQLEYFTCRNNEMQTLQMNDNVALTNLIARDNKINELDLSDATLLEELWVNDNELTALDLRNGNLAILTTFTAIRNPELTCILVDNPSEADFILRNRDEQTAVVTNCDFIGQVYIPDDVFEQKLIDKGLDNELDDYVLPQNIKNEEELLIFTINGSPKITDLTGIESFTSLKKIHFSGNDIANVDFSKNLFLEEIQAQRSEIENIILPNNTLMSNIDLWGNNISAIDVSQYTNLKKLFIPSNNLSDLDISANINLEELVLSDYVFTIDISNNKKLKTLNLGFMNLSSLDISHLSSLENLYLNNNKLISVNTENNTELKNLSINRNNLEKIDLSSNKRIESIDVSFNNLSVLDITNNFRITEFNATSNDLTCIKVWDIDYANENWSDNIDDTASFSESCNVTEIPDENFEQALIDANIDDVLDGFLLTQNASSKESLSLISKNISDLTGIEAFTSLTNLALKGNNLTSVDLSQNTALINLNIDNNQLDRLDISSNVNLTNFEALNNPNLICIQVWDVSYAENNWSDKINITATFSEDCDDIWTVEVDKDVKNILKVISGVDKNNDGEITLKEAKEYTGSLDLSNKDIQNIKGLQAFSNIKSMNLSGNDLKDLSALTGKKITLVSKNTGKKREVAAKTSKLETLIISNNSFETLNLEELKDLKVIDLSNNPNVGTISIKNGNNISITTFNSTNCPNLSCILVDNKNANYLENWSKDAASKFVSDIADCRSTILSTNDFSQKNITIYPNPVTNFLTVESTKEFDFIEIYNTIGKRVIKTQETKIDFSNYTAGIYIIKIVAKNKVLTKRVIKN